MGHEAVDAQRVREFVYAAHGDFSAVQRLLRETPELINGRDLEWDETGLDAAGHMGNREIAEYLLERGAQPTLFSAAMLGERETVFSLLHSKPEQVNAYGVHGISLLFHAALSGDVEMIEELRRLGNTQPVDDALHAAVSCGHREMAAWLLAHGADSMGKDFAGRTPLEAAQQRGDDDLITLLRAVTEMEGGDG